MQEALDVEIVGESTRDEIESIRDEWVNATSAYKLTGLTKSSFQRAIAHLLGTRGCRADWVRRGDAKNTRYSGLAIEPIKAYKSGDETLLQRLLEFAATKSASPSQSLAVVDHVADLDGKIANLQQAGATNSRLNASRIQQKLEEISRCQTAQQQRNEALSEAELLAAENRGIQQFSLT